VLGNCLNDPRTTVSNTPRENSHSTGYALTDPCDAKALGPLKPCGPNSVPFPSWKSRYANALAAYALAYLDFQDGNGTEWTTDQI